MIKFWIVEDQMNTETKTDAADAAEQWHEYGGDFICKKCGQDWNFADPQCKGGRGMSEKAICQLCGEPMPEGEEMFNYHGYSGNCPKSMNQTKQEASADAARVAAESVKVKELQQINEAYTRYCYHNEGNPRVYQGFIDGWRQGKQHAEQTAALRVAGNAELQKRVMQAIEKALRGFRVFYVGLEDMLTPDEDETIERGREAVDALADFIQGEVADVFKSPNAEKENEQ